MASESKAARKPRCRIRWGCVSVGLLGLAPGLVAIGIELARNWQYGMTSGGTVFAATYALFAVGLAVTGIATLTSTIQQPKPQPSIEDLRQAMSGGDQLERNGIDDGASRS